MLNTCMRSNLVQIKWFKEHKLRNYPLQMSLLAFGVPHLTTYIFFLFVNQPELEVLNDLAWH